MIKDIIEFYKIGKELGLTKREITSLFIFKNPRQGILSTFLYVLLLIIASVFFAILIVGYIQLERNIYPTGTRYSTVKIKDFRSKGNKT